MAVDTFLSYHHDDKGLAAQISRKLEGYGFEVFLAHEDIEPSRDWQEEILRRLGSCEVFTTLLTDEFEESNWTHQEVGIAFARSPVRPIMVPINAGVGPVGFLARYQAINLDPSRISEEHRPSWGASRFRLSYLDTQCLRIVKSIAGQNEQIASEIRKFLINRLEAVDSFDEAGVVAWKLSELDGMTPEDINRMLKVASENNQVYHAGSANYHINKLIGRHKKSIKKHMLSKFKKARGG